MANPPENAPLSLEHFLPYRLNVLATEVSQALARAYGAEFGISIPEWRVLATLGQFGSATAQAIGQHSRMHKTTVSRAVAALTRRNFITRQPNRKDMREAFLALTETGRSIYDRIVPMANAFSASLCVDLSEDDQRAFTMLIDRLTERVMALEADQLKSP